MENKEKQKQERKKSRLDHANKADRKDATVKSEKLRYKNADSIYDF